VSRRYHDAVKARHPNLSDYPGRYVAIDDNTDRVVVDAASLIELWELIRDRNLKVSIMRAPREDEPVLVGLG
jgi:S-adenosylmethionine:diacylglycerol 3-amino-3-carboxypropyl transferase